MTMSGDQEGNTTAYVPAACAVCGAYHPDEFRMRMNTMLAAHPELANDPTIEGWVFVCGDCAAHGRCPCRRSVADAA